ncbi:MAG: hypothetical protein WA730_08815 [Pseudolabrys sp.]
MAKKSKKAKRGTPARNKEGDDESDAGEEEKETGVKARARSGRSVATALGRFRRQDQRSIGKRPCPSTKGFFSVSRTPLELC